MPWLSMKGGDAKEGDGGDDKIVSNVILLASSL